MSSVMPLTFNAVKLCDVTINEKTWACANEVRRALEYGKATNTADIVKCLCTRENYAHKCQLRSVHAGCTPINSPKDSRKDEYYINETGMTELLIGSQLPLAKELAEYMGIKIIGHKYVRKEAVTIYTIQKVCEGVPMKRRFRIGSYRIDLYFPQHKLAIECDEYDHKGRDINYEIKR